MASEQDGASDPLRILPLLWRRQRAAGRAPGPALGRRPRLTVDAVVSAAIRLADAQGLTATSMSRVAAALGVGTMTLYTYVPSKAELLDLMVDEVLGERGLPGPGDARPEHWRDQVGLYVENTRKMYRHHPWLCAVSLLRPPIGPGLLAEEEYVLSTLVPLGLSPRQQVAAASTITGYVTATARLEVESVELERLTGQSNDSWWQDRMTFWEEYFDVDRHPTMTDMWHRGGYEASTAEQTAAAHEFGLQRLLDGIEAVADGGSARPGSCYPSLPGS